MDGEEVLGDGEGDARAGQLARVHVAVDPDRGPHPIGIGADGEEPEVAALGRAADRREPGERGEGLAPARELRGDRGVVEVVRAEAAREVVQLRHGGALYPARPAARSGAWPEPGQQPAIRAPAAGRPASGVQSRPAAGKIELLRSAFYAVYRRRFSCKDASISDKYPNIA